MTKTTKDTKDTIADIEQKLNRCLELVNILFLRTRINYSDIEEKDLEFDNADKLQNVSTCLKIIKHDLSELKKAVE